MAIVKVNFFSESLMRTVNFLAVVPIDKRSVDGNVTRSKDKPFKTLYLLHGIYGSEYDWVTSTRIKQLAMDHNLVVIMPAGENKFYSDQGGYHDHFGSFIGEELVNFTRTMFRLSDKREDTYVAGLSMGGLGAFYAGLRYPDTFGYIGAFSSALEGMPYPKDNDGPRLHMKRMFYEAVMGPEENFKDGPMDYYTLADKIAASGKDIPKIYMAVGESDHLRGVNEKYCEHLKELGIDVDFFEDEGAHEWGFWDKHIERFIEWLPLEEKFEGLSSGKIQ
jgi:putative tributyrin esterase